MKIFFVRRYHALLRKIVQELLQVSKSYLHTKRPSKQGINYNTYICFELIINNIIRYNNKILRCFDVFISYNIVDLLYIDKIDRPIR